VKGDEQRPVACFHRSVSLVAPEGIEYHGRDSVGAFLSTVPGNGQLERFRLVPTRANGQPAFGCYLCDPHTLIARAYGLMVLTLSGEQVSEITGFADTGIFGLFGLPRTLPL
jgi:hypothetical protein